MSNSIPFTPGATLALSATTSSGSGTITAASSSLRVVNAGPGLISIRWGKGAQTALTTDMPMLAGTVEVFSKPEDADTFAAISASTSAVYVTSGEGQ